ncbi:uncharacterized protein LOC117641396 [Thrips palmi]|uniref:Uncharacterized protein LOC117641396 n=1 Tax=Thrips palmi TaxID=161013 RepID=A0A6P8YKR6_THRPL|nr:uncharacterized protein LOC117641396 [Thrips palmi]
MRDGVGAPADADRAAAEVGRCSHEPMTSATHEGPFVADAMECLHHDLRHEGLHRHIHVTTIQPFFINTFARLGSALKFGGPFRALMRFLEPDEVARLVVEAVAARKHVVCIPGHVSLVGKLLGFLPRRALAFVFERVMRLESRPPFSYEHRHKALDPCILHELLSKGYPLEEDPVDVCAGLCADLGDDLGDDPQGLQGLQDGPLQYDFSPFSRQVAEFYRSRGQDIPPSVRKVFHVA